ncbi:MAG TPA: HAD family hydrolase [Micromonosporaceae bacterium]|nr:HAD family hydrolase [Micromonosporaceae bacterium]
MVVVRGEPYRAVLFDLFGTLTRAVRRGPAHDAIARRLGCAPAAYARALNETFFDRCVGALGDPAEALAAVAARAGGHPGADDIRSALHDRVEALRKDITLRPEAVPVLRELRARGLRTALVSDCGPEVPSMVPGLPIAPLLDATVFSIEIARHKPDPLMYLTASARLSVRPAGCLFVGDGGSRELSGAVAAGMTAVRLTAPDLADHLAFDREQGWDGPTIDNLAELPRLIATGFGDHVRGASLRRASA